MDDFFSKPNKLNCYIAGLIAADGNVYKNRLTITAHKKDSDHLRAISDILGVESLYYNLNDHCVRLRKSSKQWVQDLEKNFNIVPNKSLILKPPPLKMPSHIYPFIAGYVAGDGTIGYKKPGGNRNWTYLRLYIAGTLAMMEWMRDKLPHVSSTLSPHKTIWTLEYNSYSALEAFYKIYDPTLPLLERKFEGVVVKKYVGLR